VKHRRPVSVIVILAFLQLLVSCSIHIRKTVRGTPEDIIGGTAQNPLIIRVLMKSGETIEFSKEEPGYVLGDKIFRKDKMRSVNFKGHLAISKDDDIYVIKTVSGETYRCRSYRITDDGDKLVMEVEPKPPIPLSEVDMVWTRQTDAVMSTVMSVLATLGVIVLGSTILVFIMFPKGFVFVPTS